MPKRVKKTKLSKMTHKNQKAIRAITIRMRNHRASKIIIFGKLDSQHLPRLLI